MKFSEKNRDRSERLKGLAALLLAAAFISMPLAGCRSNHETEKTAKPSVSRRADDKTEKEDPGEKTELSEPAEKTETEASEKDLSPASIAKKGDDGSSSHEDEAGTESRPDEVTEKESEEPRESEAPSETEKESEEPLESEAPSETEKESEEPRESEVPSETEKPSEAGEDEPELRGDELMKDFSRVLSIVSFVGSYPEISRSSDLMDLFDFAYIYLNFARPGSFETIQPQMTKEPELYDDGIFVRKADLAEAAEEIFGIDLREREEYETVYCREEQLDYVKEYFELPSDIRDYVKLGPKFSFDSLGLALADEMSEKKGGKVNVKFTIYGTMFSDFSEQMREAQTLDPEAARTQYESVMKGEAVFIKQGKTYKLVSFKAEAP